MEDASGTSHTAFAEYLRQRWTVLLGVMMILLGAYMVWIRRDTLNFTFLLSQSVIVLFGVLMLANPVKTVMNNVAIYALGLGLSRIIRGLPLVFDERTFMFLMGCGILAVGGSLAYTGVMFLKGKARGYRRMIYMSCLVFLVLNCMFSMMRYADLDDYIFLVVDEQILMIESLLMCLLYGCLAFVLMDDRIRSRGYYEMVENGLNSTIDVVNLPDDVRISARDAACLTDSGLEGWADGDSRTPVRKQYGFDASSANGDLRCYAQLWNGDDRVYFTITANRKGTMVQALRFRADRMVLSDGRLTVAGENGFLASFDVLPQEDPEQVPGKEASA